MRRLEGVLGVLGTAWGERGCAFGVWGLNFGIWEFGLGLCEPDLIFWGKTVPTGGEFCWGLQNEKCNF